ncbi:hypothetical protein [Polluticoccus soli]|uniref:hypothetical protein n=1 Tax=Polluticoccus soli TaxID=3034150 RepID=UPI0023E306F0|nr:hypothetical protein [Flavipsychrobacter sp. JY13-12]
MKHLWIFALLAIAATGCQKKYCWTCNVDTKDSLSGSGGVVLVQTINYDTLVCDMTESAIHEFEKDMTSNFSRTIEDSFVSYTDRRMVCNKAD